MKSGIKNNGAFSFLENSAVLLEENQDTMTREPWLMLMARRGRKPTETLCWGMTNNGSSFARIGTQEGDLVNGFVHEDPYKTRMLGPYTYITDETGEFFSNTWYPVMRKDQRLRTTYNFGSLASETSCLGLSVKTENFIPDGFDGLIQILTIKNLTAGEKSLRLYSVNPINIGDARDIQFSGFNTLMMGGALYDGELDGLVWRSHFGIPFQDDPSVIKGMFGKVLFHSTSLGCAQYSTKYEDFVGHYSRTMANPEAVSGNGLACRAAEELTSALSAVMNTVTLKAGEEREIIVAAIAGSTEDYYCNGKKELKEILETIKDPVKTRKLLAAVDKSWTDQMALLRVHVPGKEILTHSFRWLQYQCAMVASLNRMKSRFHSGFEYGYGFRDILQDLLALLPYDAAQVKETLKYVSGQMFSDGTVYHNFFVSAPGNRNFTACDDPLWLVFAVCEYVKETGDLSFPSCVVPYADSKESLPEKSASVFDHCMAAVNRVWANSRDGLPVMFDADWNDDLGGYGEHLSVMTAQMLYKALTDLSQLCDRLDGRMGLAVTCRERAETVRMNVGRFCFDSQGQYIRLLGTDEKGESDLGSCDTDGLSFFEPVAWAGYSGIATREEFVRVSAMAEKKLADSAGYAICSADTVLAEGRLPKDEHAWKRNAPGKKENGGAFRHLESWYIASLCRFGFGEKACGIYFGTLPAVCSAEDPYTYAAERFVYPEYVSGPKSCEHGRAGHTWLTGTAPTRQRVLIESIFGLECTYDGLRVNPCVDPSWKSFSAYRRFRGAGFTFQYRNPEGLEQGVRSLAVDGVSVDGSVIPKGYYDGKEHIVEVLMGV